MNNIMVYKSKLTYEEIAPVLKELNDIPYAVIKGETLSLAAYNSVGKRVSSDVDILISRENITLLEELLIKYGFSSLYYDNRSKERINRVMMLSSSHQVSPFHKKKGVLELSIDINFDVFWGEYNGRRIDINEFLSDTKSLDIYGVKVKALTPIKAMVQLILHHYKEVNSLYHLATHNAIKYNMFKDIYYLWKNNTDEISLNKLYSLSEEMDIVPFVYYIFHYTNIIFKDEELAIYVKAFENTKGIELLDKYGLSEDEKKIWRVDFNTRLEEQNIYELIKDDLTSDDIKKIGNNRKIFR